jgi:inhibitor of KinA sporulation pathway (predicted exonuclease)
MDNVERSPYIYTSLDLELNNPEYEIIQIGAMIGDIRTGEIFEKLSVIIHTSNKLCEIDDPKKGLTNIVQLTGITQEMVDKGISLEEGYKQLDKIHSRIYNGFRPFRNCMTWGGGDSSHLKSELEKRGIKFSEKEGPGMFCFGRRWIDIKSIFQFYQMAKGDKTRSGLAKSLRRFGMNFKGQKHDALDDAINTFLLACRLREKIL